MTQYVKMARHSKILDENVDKTVKYDSKTKKQKRKELNMNNFQVKAFAGSWRVAETEKVR